MNKKQILRRADKIQKRKKQIGKSLEALVSEAEADKTGKQKIIEEPKKIVIEKILSEIKSTLNNVNEFFYKHIWISAVAFEAGLIWDAYINHNYQPAINTNSIQNIDSSPDLTRTFGKEKVSRDFGEVSEFYKHHFSSSATSPAGNRYFQENNLTFFFPFYAGYIQRALTGSIKYLQGLSEELKKNKCRGLAESVNISRMFASENPNLLGDFVGASAFVSSVGAYMVYAHNLEQIGVSIDWGRAVIASGFLSTVAGIGAFWLNEGIHTYSKRIFYSGHPDRKFPREQHSPMNFDNFMHTFFDSTNEPAEEIFSSYVQYVGKFECDVYEQEITILQDFIEQKRGAKRKNVELSLLEKFREYSDVEEILRDGKKQMSRLVNLRKGKKQGLFERFVSRNDAHSIYRLLKEHQQGKRKSLSLSDLRKKQYVILSQEEEMEFEKIKSSYAGRPLSEFLPLIRTALVCVNAGRYEKAIEIWDEVFKECKSEVEKSETLCIAAKSIELSPNHEHKQWARQRWKDIVEEYRSSIEFYNESNQKFDGSANVVYVVGEKLLKSTIVVKSASDESNNSRILDECSNLQYFAKALEGRIPRVIDLFKINGKNHLILEHKGRTLYDVLKNECLPEEKTEKLFSEAVELLAKIHHYGRAGQASGELKFDRHNHTVGFYEHRLKNIFFDNLLKYSVQKELMTEEELGRKIGEILPQCRPLLRKLAETHTEFYYKDANLRNWIKTPEAIIAVDFEKSIQMSPQFDLISLLEFEPYLSSDEIMHFCRLYLKNIRNLESTNRHADDRFLQRYRFCRPQRHLELAGYRLRDLMKNETNNSEVMFHIDNAILSIAHLLHGKNFGKYDKYLLEKFTENLADIRGLVAP
ncbi:MAG TPA: phosphotransferase [Candidatus Nanoarchaeia archaeon]|nr:phosphotransferase [Candidatus Nanoarchaeia archaeon]